MMFLRFFQDSPTVASRGKSGQGEWGRSGKGADENNMAWVCELLLGVIGDKLQ